MRRKVLFGAIGVGVVGLFMAGPVAHADSGDAKLYFSKHAVPGGAVELSGICHADKAMAYSNELEPHAITLVRRNNLGDISANAKVGKNVKPGIYQVRFDCGDTKQHVQIEIEPVQQKPSKPTTGKPAQAKPEAGQVAVKPKGAANTGEGDVDTATPVREQGPNTGLFVLGGAGVLAAGGAGAFMLRRRSRTQG